MKTYIQIGANKGNDTFYQRIQKLNSRSRVILIEPNSSLIQKLIECYKPLQNFHDIIILNVGIVHDKSINKLVTYGKTSSNIIDGLSSVIERKSCPEWPKQYLIDFVPMTFNELCTTYQINEIENLYIDTEGYDYTIIDNINLEDCIIHKIECEKWSHDSDSSSDIKTGPSFFENVLKPKLLQKYSMTEEIHEDMLTHVFILIDNTKRKNL